MVGTASFVDFGLNPKIVAILERQGITVPSPIQAQAIGPVLEGKDVIGIAQTGTGKTLAFGLPLIEYVQKTQLKALVLAPTRELALQIEESIRNITKYLPIGFKTITLIGGVPPQRQIQDLKKNPSLIVATPGRLLDLMERRVLNLDAIGYLVLDEADRMFDMGFAPQVRKILAKVTRVHQTLLFSATMSNDVAALAASCQKNPVRIEVTPAGSTVAGIKHELCFVVSKEHKTQALQTILKEDHKSVLVFSRTKHGANKLSQKIATMGHQVAEIHSNKSLGQRKRALEGFKSGQYRVLVATDVASRGIDVPNISLVVNYDLPDAPEDYIHRIGRTGRAGKDGRAVSLATTDQMKEVTGIERLMKAPLPLTADSLARPVATYSSNRSRTPSRSYSSQRSYPQRSRQYSSHF